MFVNIPTQNILSMTCNKEFGANSTTVKKRQQFRRIFLRGCGYGMQERGLEKPLFKQIFAGAGQSQIFLGIS